MRTNEFAVRLRELMAQRDTGVRDLARKVPCDKAYISRIANGTARPSHRIVARLDKLLGADGELMVLAGQDVSLPVWSGTHPPSGEEERDPVRRRMFHQLAGAGFMSVVLADLTGASTALDGVEAFAATLGYGGPASEEADRLDVDLERLRSAVAAVKRSYQACRYSAAAQAFPGLLADLAAASSFLDGDNRRTAFALSAEAHHVAASVLLKLGDKGLAWLAADRSMRAARDSEDPLTLGSSARIVTHALMDGGHMAAATRTARAHAERLERDGGRPAAELLSVYGALLLRGAIAASQQNERGAALELIDEADEAARRLGGDFNYRWTAFGPVNVLVHRVAIAVTLGDAGMAVAEARKIDLDRVPVAERKASLLVDTSCALVQWGKHEKAFELLRAAAQFAPQELSARPSAHRLLRDLAQSSPPRLQKQVGEFSARLGVRL